MKSFVRLPAGLLGVLLLTAGCGGSNGDNGGGSPDASVESSVGTDGGSPGTGNEGGGDETSSTTPDGAAPVCGDGVLANSTKECDDGAKNGTPGDPCTDSCQWVCVQGDPTRGDTSCNTGGDPCLGTATCQADHTCQAGTPLANGASCGTSKVCNNGHCTSSVCGDAIVTPPEECDDGSNNGKPADGCTSACKFVCVSTDPARNCTPADPCAGQGTCNDTTHVCTPGTPLGTGTFCGGELPDGGSPDGGAVDICKGGTCIPGSCGDGVLEPGEQCDFGAGNGPGTGCELTCKFSCALSPNSCTQPADICAGPNTCTSVVVSGASGQKCVQGQPLTDGTSCGAGGAGKCKSGVCQTATCGDGVVETGEQCDFGAGKNIAGSGCEPDCLFSCTKTPDNCAANDLCLAAPMTCQNITGPNNDVGQKCQAAAHTATCGVCDTATTGDFVCASNKCSKSICGDSCIDSRIGETCDPPNGTTCDPSCHTIVAAVCGNAKRENGEQCDDGNTKNLDGCDSKCQFEQDQRANTVSIHYTAGGTCAHNMLGTQVLTSTAAQNLNTTLTTAVNNGTTNIQFKFMGLTDLSGVGQSSGLFLGALSGPPTTTTGYNGASDKDWWYTTALSTIDGNRNPLSQLPASFTNTALKATGTIDLSLVLGGANAILHMSSSVITANAVNVSAPLTSAGAPPGHLASENLDPALKSFDTMQNGVLCGNISAASLATVPIPAVLITPGLAQCGQLLGNTYTAANKLLDVIVGGCQAAFGVTAINASPKPDQVDPAAPPAGAGFQYTLSEDSGHHVTGCTDKTGASVTLATCLSAAAYSAYFDFTSDRVIMK